MTNIRKLQAYKEQERQCEKIQQKTLEREMGLKGKLVSQTSVKWDGDFFHLFQAPYQFPEITPHLVQSADLPSVIVWTYNIDGVKSVAKEIVESVVVSEKKKSMTFKVIEGDLLKVYTTMKITVEVEGNGEEKMVTWSNGSVPDPTSLVDFAINFTKDVERSRLLIPN